MKFRAGDSIIYGRLTIVRPGDITYKGRIEKVHLNYCSYEIILEGARNSRYVYEYELTLDYKETFINNILNHDV